MFESRPEVTIRNEILGTMQNALSKNEGTYNFDVAGATAIGIKTLEDYIEWLHKQLFPWSVTDDYYLDLHMKVWNLTRISPTFARGQATFTGNPNVTIPTGTIVISRLGATFQTTNPAVTNVDGTATANIEALQSGEVGNTAIGDITTLQISIAGIFAVTNTSRIEGGYEIETFESAKKRMADKASLPAHSGNVNDYINWCRSIAGVGSVKVVGAGELGVLPGYVEIYITDFKNEPAGTQLVADVQKYLNTVRPVPSTVTVFSKVPLTIDVTIDTVNVKTGSFTEEQYIQKIRDAIGSSIANQQFAVNDIVSIPRTTLIILGIEGTIDLNNLKLNGATSNIVLSQKGVAVLGGVTINEFTES